MKPARTVVVMGASAGGVESLREVVRRLPDAFAAAVLVALHMPPDRPSALPKILSGAGPLDAHHPADGEPLEAGRIYVASPGQDLMVEGKHVRLRKGAQENRFRPSIDALFQSAAYDFGPQVIAVVLSGALDDGAPGLASIKRAGGIAIVQTPDDAAFDSMPLAALGEAQVDYVLPAAEIGALLRSLVPALDKPGWGVSLLAPAGAPSAIATSTPALWEAAEHREGLRTFTKDAVPRRIGDARSAPGRAYASTGAPGPVHGPAGSGSSN